MVRTGRRRIGSKDLIVAPVLDCSTTSAVVGRDMLFRSLCCAAISAGAACTPSAPLPASTRTAAAPAPPDPARPREGAELLGKAAPEWHAERWINSPPLSLTALHGKVVFARWWTAGCPFCAASAPALREVHEQYKDRGLVVIGFYHHKETTPFDPSVYSETAKKYRFDFPLAVDPEWSTLHTWWLDGHDRDATSASFLVDKQGRFRFVHPGGTLAKSDKEYAELRVAIETALGE